jgi:hypothetical protein
MRVLLSLMVVAGRGLSADAQPARFETYFDFVRVESRKFGKVRQAKGFSEFTSFFGRVEVNANKHC